MKRSLVTTFVAVLSVAGLGAGSVHAADLFSGIPGDPRVSVGVSAGTLGVGPEINLHGDHGLIGVRLGADFLSFDANFKRDNIKYNATANLRTGGATLDLYPFHTGFRVSAGFRINGNSVDLSANPASASLGNVRLGGQSFSAAGVGSISGTASYNAVSPYVGVGYSYGFMHGRLPVAFDVGAMFQGDSQLNLAANGPLRTSPIVQKQLAVESHTIRNYLNDASVYPVAMLSVGWKF